MPAVSRVRIAADVLTRGRSYSYGPDRSQRCDLRLPRGPGPHPLIVLVHGGSWQARYGKIVMRGVAGDLARRGWATWNIEYRRVGNGGGWPSTFEDVAAAIDYLPRVDANLQLDNVTLLGHSAGGHLALWAASRGRLQAGAPGALGDRPAVEVARIISQAGVVDLAGAYVRWRGGAVRALMGASPEERPDRYSVGDPMELLPPGVPVVLIHGLEDETVSVELSRNYARAARAAGAQVELVEIAGRAGQHRAHIDPRGVAWATAVRHLTPVTR
jgi:acetyl esterase/lipase